MVCYTQMYIPVVKANSFAAQKDVASGFCCRKNSQAGWGAQQPPIQGAKAGRPHSSAHSSTQASGHLQGDRLGGSVGILLLLHQSTGGRDCALCTCGHDLGLRAEDLEGALTKYRCCPVQWKPCAGWGGTGCFPVCRDRAPSLPDSSKVKKFGLNYWVTLQKLEIWELKLSLLQHTT